MKLVESKPHHLNNQGCPDLVNKVNIKFQV